MALMDVWAAVLIVYGVSAEMKISAANGLNQPLPLDMAENSVDDMYDKCEDKMESKVQNYLQNEINNNGKFKKAWGIAERKYNNKMESPLNKDQILAIYVYTLNNPQIYFDFNKAVRTQKSVYGTSFGYHALHFFLTSAIKKLKKKQEECVTGFRRVNRYFSQDVQNMEIRFGSFTSSSKDTYPSITFGTKSCFEIYTCLGASIVLYSKFKDKEGEVLIPPYEVFKVTEINKNSDQGLQCEVVYKLKSTNRSRSDLNCTLS